MWPQGNNSALQPGKEPSQDYFKDEGFEINWSLFKWVSVKTNSRKNSSEPIELSSINKVS